MSLAAILNIPAVMIIGNYNHSYMRYLPAGDRQQLHSMGVKAASRSPAFAKLLLCPLHNNHRMYFIYPIQLVAFSPASSLNRLCFACSTHCICGTVTLMLACLQTIAQREVAALLGINSGRGPKARQRRKQNIIVQVQIALLQANGPRCAFSGCCCSSCNN